jgi:hypothetical protein
VARTCFIRKWPSILRQHRPSPYAARQDAWVSSEPAGIEPETAASASCARLGSASSAPPSSSVSSSRLSTTPRRTSVGVIQTSQWVKDHRIAVRGEHAVNHDGMQMRVEPQVRAHALHHDAEEWSKDHTDRSALALDVFLVANPALIETEDRIDGNARSPLASPTGDTRQVTWSPVRALVLTSSM